MIINKIYYFIYKQILDLDPDQKEIQKLSTYFNKNIKLN